MRAADALRRGPAAVYKIPARGQTSGVGREPGQQPPPAKCDRLAGRVPYGAFILYNGKEWDTRYDWGEHERRNPGTVPRVILDLMRSLSQ